VKFYGVVDLGELQTLRTKGMSKDFGLFLDKAVAVAKAEFEEGFTIVEVDVQDPDSELGPDTFAVDMAAEALMTTARPAVSEAEETGLSEQSTGEPLTWDDPDDLREAKALVKFAAEGLTWQESIDQWSTVETLRRIPPERIALAAPIDTSEISSEGEYAKAVEETEPVALTSLGAPFWVWLIMLIQYLALGRSPIEDKREAARTRKTAARKRVRARKRVKAKRVKPKNIMEAEA